MPRYLSPAWFAAATAIAPPPSSAGTTIALEQVVVGGPEGEVRYCVRVMDERVSIEPGGCDGADATFTVDYPTAVALFSGELTPEAALMAGHMKVAGDIGALLANQAGLSGIGAAFDELRADTTF